MEPVPTHEIDAARAIVRLARMLERAGGELSLPHYRVLAAVAAGDEQATRVAKRLALAKPTISASVDALCRRGLLERGDVAGDLRVSALRLTPAGAQLLAETEAAMLARLTDVLERVPDRTAVLAALAGLGTALDEIADERLSARLAGRGGCR